MADDPRRLGGVVGGVARDDPLGLTDPSEEGRLDIGGMHGGGGQKGQHAGRAEIAFDRGGAALAEADVELDQITLGAIEGAEGKSGGDLLVQVVVLAESEVLDRLGASGPEAGPDLS